MIRQIKINTRILSVIMSAALISTVSPVTIYAAESSGVSMGASSVATIRSFEVLEPPFFPVEDFESTYFLIVEQGTALTDLNLPDSLTATLEKTAYVTYTKEDIVTVVERIPVTWDSNPSYYPEVDSGSWIFTAQLPEGYALGDGVPLLEIYVMTGAAAMLADGVYNIADASVDITGAGTYTITGESTENTVLVSAAFGEIDITLDNLEIENGSVSPFRIIYNSGANITLTLIGDSVLNSTGNSDAGLQKPEGSGLLKIIGSGSLTAIGMNGAGIGGGYNGSTENILIAGDAKVTARSTGTSAGIGGGYGGNGKKITIAGNAVVNAYGGSGLSNGAGIGGGNLGGDGSDILITDNAIVNASSGNRASGIGGGYGGNGNNITISGNALVHATGGVWSAGIGGGNVDINVGGGSGSGNSVSGNAVVFATGGLSGDPVQGMTQAGGILFQGTDGKMVGDVTMTHNVDIPTGHTIIVPFGNTLTNEGVLFVYGTLEYGGANGELVNNGTMNISPASTTLTVRKDAQLITEAAYGDTVTLEMVARSAARARAANSGMVDFYLETSNVYQRIGNSGSSYVNGVAMASLSISLTGNYWSANPFPKVLFVEYGGTVPSGTTGSTGMLDSAAWGSLIVKPAALTLTGITAIDRKYDGTTEVFLSGGTLSGVVPGETVALPTTGIIPNANVGTGKPVIPRAPSWQNYTLTASTSLTVNITPAEPTVTFSTIMAMLPYTGTSAVITAPRVTLVNGEQYSGAVLYSFQPSAGAAYLSGLPTDVGTYEIKAGIAAEGNYTAADGSNEVRLTITSMVPTLTINSYADSVYTGQALADPTDITSSIPDPVMTYAWYIDNGGVKGDKLLGSPKDAGIYHVEGSVAATDNTVAVTSGAVRFTIGKATTPGAEEGSLIVYNNEALSYAFDLRQFLTPGLHFGGETYEIKTTVANSYYDLPTDSDINDGILVVSVKAVNSSVEGIVGTINVTVKSKNYMDMDALLTVSAVNKLIPPVTGGSSDSGGTDNSEYNFWMGVKDKMSSAASGDVLMVNARAYDKMPVTVMNELRQNSGVAMVISWKVGKDITIPAGSAQKKEAGRIYYPLSLLAELYKDIAFVKTPVEQDEQKLQTGVPAYIQYPDGKQIPVTDVSLVTVDAQEVLPIVPETLPAVSKVITPPDKGFEEDTFAGTPDAKNAASRYGMPIAAIIVILAVLCGGGLWIWKKKKGDM